MNKSRFGIITIMAALTGGIGLASSAVDAAEVVRWPGAQCKLRPISNNGTLGEYGGTISSIHATNDANVVCPFTHNPLQAAPQGAIVTVFDRHTVENVSCTLFAETAFGNGSVGGFSDTGASSGSGLGSQQFSLDMDSEDSGNYAYGRCTIPNWQSGQANPSHLISWLVDDEWS
jgi:hypothetical protein